MTKRPNPFLHRQMLHDTWATGKLIERCRKLAPDQLELTTPGTYGTIRATLQHIVSADEGYLVRLTGTPLHAMPFRQTDPATLDDIAAHLEHVKDAVERLFSGPPLDAERILTDTPLRPAGAPRFEMATWAPATQLIYHGVDHRSQIDTILSVHGLETIDMQVWPYAIELGASRQVE
ncbi:MAG: DUF664 domain-containing protein [Chloroflexi bacterium]|nr:MAG: DUF664 domain-containing protein [Chloroflexota bacterium]TMC57431.1 MAG: DUF664 domain-containing protein [Chloroflexota bacterium]